jgi:hypothetical protein
MDNRKQIDLCFITRCGASRSISSQTQLAFKLNLRTSSECQIPARNLPLTLLLSCTRAHEGCVLHFRQDLDILVFKRCAQWDIIGAEIICETVRPGASIDRPAKSAMWFRTNSCPTYYSVSVPFDHRLKPSALRLCGLVLTLRP